MVWPRINDKKEKLATMLAASGFLKLSEAAKLRRSCLTVLAYHRVFDILPGQYPFDEETVSTSCDMFDRQMNFVSKNFDVITFAYLKKCLEGCNALPGRPLVITFDDGYADNYFNAFPSLKKYNLPATLFVTTGYIGTLQPFWFEKIAFWVKHSQDISSVLKQFGITFDSGVEVTSDRILDFLKKIGDHVRIQIMEECEKERLLMPDEKEVDMIRPLSWDEIREMSAWGIEIGSHTVTHPILSRVSDEKLRFELYESKKKIEDEIGKEVLAVAYPVGKRDAQNEKVFNEAEKSGYFFGITYDEGFDTLRPLDRYRIRRIDVERIDSLNLFRSQLLLPQLFYNTFL